jgi:hypothetical protein
MLVKITALRNAPQLRQLGFPAVDGEVREKKIFSLEKNYSGSEEYLSYQPVIFLAFF